jgi:hypothetical protein
MRRGEFQTDCNVLFDWCHQLKVFAYRELAFFSPFEPDTNIFPFLFGREHR